MGNKTQVKCRSCWSDVPLFSPFFSWRLRSILSLRSLLKGIDVRKATGLDKIPNRLLKIAAEVVAPSLSGIFSQSPLFGIFPSDWKLSPNFKNGSKSDLNDYQPTSVIPAIANFFSVLKKNIYDQLCYNLNKNGLLNKCQSGFRSLHSTLTACLGTNGSWCTCVNINRGLLNGVIFIDLKKAFDTIDQKKKLTKYGVD